MMTPGALHAATFACRWAVCDPGGQVLGTFPLQLHALEFSPAGSGRYVLPVATSAAPPIIERVALLRDAVRMVADRLDQAARDPATAGHQVASALSALDYAREAAVELTRAFSATPPPAAKEA